jgi:hypothetical protein
MKESTIIGFIFSVIAFIGVRGIVMTQTMRAFLSRKGYKKYKENTGFWNRWFFVSARYIVRDKYSKFEGRIIQYTCIIRILFILNLILHIGLFIEMSIMFMVSVGKLNNQIANSAIGMYLLLIWISCMIIGLTSRYEYRRYHRMRERRK